MRSVSVSWFGPYSLDGLTPREISRKMGVYAVVCGTSYLFIGKAKRGKGVFREAKASREPEYWEGLRKLKMVSGEKPAWYWLKDAVHRNCRLYAGVIQRADIDSADDAERLLVYINKPILNEKYVNRLETREEIKLINAGSIPPGLGRETVPPG